MKALQSDLFKRMVAAGVNVTEKLLNGEPIIFEGITYTLKKVPKAN